MTKKHRHQANCSSSSLLLLKFTVFILLALCLQQTHAQSKCEKDKSDSVLAILLKEIPEWAPGRSLQMRYIIIDSSGMGAVVTTEENMNAPVVSQVASFKYDANVFPCQIADYEKYKSFYGIDEDSDGRIVEGNPQTIVLSFFNNGQLMEFIRLSGALAYSDKPDGQFQLPKAVMELRDKLLAYAQQAEPQPRAEYYMTVSPYNENERAWLLRSTQLEAIPIITNASDERDLVFLDKLVKGAPAFLPLQEEHLLRLKKNMNLSEKQYKKTFRTSEEANEIIEVIFMKSVY